MTIFQLITIILSLTALGSYINTKFIKLPTSVGVLIVSIFVSSSLIISSKLGFYSFKNISTLISQFEFEELLLHGMLAILLFAGALHVNIKDLKTYKIPIFTFATLGTFLATFITGFLLYFIALFLDINFPLPYALLFGALISPTDPVPVLALMGSNEKLKSLKAKLTGEALFNDGTAIVLFISILAYISKPTDIDFMNISLLLVKEIIGGILLGGTLGILVFFLFKGIDAYEIEILITISLAMSSYTLAEYLHVSAPISTVVAGLIIGNPATQQVMSEKTKEHLYNFWTLADEILTAMLFLLVGLEILEVKINYYITILAAFAILTSLIGRFVSVYMPAVFLKHIFSGFDKKTLSSATIMTWSGLKGGISIALALSLPHSEFKDVILSCTYAVVIFSLLIQGLTINKFTNIILK